MSGDHLTGLGKTSFRRKFRTFGLCASAAAFSVSLGMNTAMATCGTPSTQLTGGSTATVLTFSTINKNTTVTVNNLSFFCTTGTSANSVAALFASLPDGSAGTTSGSCTPSGSLSGWTSGAASGSNVTFTSTTGTPPITFSSNVTQGTTSTSGGTLGSTLSLKTVCVGSTGNWTNQEYHSGTNGGSIIDWKRGASDPKDPTTTIGTWSLNGNQVSYTYAAGGTYNYTVWQNTDGTLDFCNGTTPVVSSAKVISGQSAC